MEDHVELIQIDNGDCWRNLDEEGNWHENRHWASTPIYLVIRSYLEDLTNGMKLIFGRDEP